MGQRKVYAEELEWDFSEFMVVSMVDPNSSDHCWVPMDKVLKCVARGDYVVTHKTEDFDLVIVNEVAHDIMEAWKENWEETIPTEVLYESRKFQKGAFWDMTGEELYDDYQLGAQGVPEWSIDDYIAEFEHQDGWLNPKSVVRFKELVQLEVESLEGLTDWFNTLYNKVLDVLKASREEQEGLTVFPQRLNLLVGELKEVSDKHFV